MMGADPDWFIQKKLAKTPQGLEFFGKEALAEYMRCFRNPETIHAICEDYRATFGVDLEMDTKDFDGGPQDRLPGAAPVGRDRRRRPQPQAGRRSGRNYATDIRGAKALPCGHYLSEEAPEETYRELRSFSWRGDCSPSFRSVMAGHGRPKDGVASLAYVPAISILKARPCHVDRDAPYMAGHDVERWTS